SRQRIEHHLARLARHQAVHLVGPGELARHLAQIRVDGVDRLPDATIRLLDRNDERPGGRRLARGIRQLDAARRASDEPGGDHRQRLRWPSSAGLAGARSQERRGDGKMQHVLEPVYSFAGPIVSRSTTRSTPPVFWASSTARARAASLGTVPFSVTTCRFTSTSMSLPLSAPSPANFVLRLVRRKASVIV